MCAVIDRVTGRDVSVICGTLHRDIYMGDHYD